MIPLRLQSTDAGAPVLNTSPGSLIAVLDVFLVTTLGWTKEFSGTNKAAYRNPLGTTQSYLQVDDTLGVRARVRAFDAMTDVDTGSNAFPTIAVAANYYWSKGSWGYDLLGTNKCFYYMCYTLANLSGQHLNFFGDFNSASTIDDNNCLLVAGTAAQTGWNRNPFHSTINPFYVKALPDNTNLGYRCRLMPKDQSIDVNNAVDYPDFFTGGHNLSDVNIYSIVTSKTGAHGVLPGMMHSNNSLLDGGVSILAGDTFLDENSNTLLVCRSVGQGFVNNQSTWRAIYIDKDWG